MIDIKIGCMRIGLAADNHQTQMEGSTQVRVVAYSNNIQNIAQETEQKALQIFLHL
jgi:hypothetical protein